MESFATNEINCRTCLTTDSEKYTNISDLVEINGYYEDEDSAVQILDCLKYCLQSKFSMEISMPQYICKECLSKLIVAYDFIKIAMQSEDTLQRQQFEIVKIGTSSNKIKGTEIEYCNAAEEDEFDLENTCKGNQRYELTDETQESYLDEICGDEEEDGMDLDKSIEADTVQTVENDSSDKIRNNTEVKMLKRLLQFQCELCSYDTNSSFNLRRHYVGKHKIFPTAEQLKQKESSTLDTLGSSAANLPQCKVCGKVFKKNYLLNSHLNMHKGINPYQCQLCSHRCRYKCNIRRHYKVKHSIDPTEEMLQPNNVEQSTAEINDNDLNIKQCQFIRSNSVELNSHLSREHVIQIEDELENSISKEAKPYNPYIYMCSKCSRKFKMLHVLKTHELTCNKKIKIALKEDFSKKPYKCTQCSSRFAIREYLMTHCSLVHRERTHRCEICEKSFKLPSQLKSHIARHATKRAFQCDQCEKSYIYKSELNVHRRTHTGEQPYTCNLCSENFQNAGHLAAHKNKQHLNAEFQCPHCTKIFNSKAKLQLHRYKHTNMPYKCKVCLKEFDKRHHIRRHMARVHNTDISEEDLAAMFARNMKRNNRYDVFKLNDKLKANSS